MNSLVSGEPWLVRFSETCGRPHLRFLRGDEVLPTLAKFIRETRYVCYLSLGGVLHKVNCDASYQNLPAGTHPDFVGMGLDLSRGSSRSFHDLIVYSREMEYGNKIVYAEAYDPLSLAHVLLTEEHGIQVGFATPRQPQISD